MLNKNLQLNIDDYDDQIRDAAIKFYLVYKALGWEVSHGWVTKPSDVTVTITELVAHAIKELNRGKEDGYIATGGLRVDYNRDADYMVNIEITVEIGYICKFDETSKK